MTAPAAPDSSSPRARSFGRATTQGQAGASSTRENAVRGFRRIQLATGAMLLLSAAAGSYLLATDKSLWLQAVSHAVGLIIIVVIDLVLGAYSLASSKSVYLPSIAAGVLGFALQGGDVFTAPQYNMTIPYFARYLLGLGAFDILLALQAGIVVAGVLGRPHARYLSRRKSKSQRLDYTRRGFIRAAAAMAGLVGVGVLVSSVKLPAPTSSKKTTTTGSIQGSVANVNDLKVGVPVYFEYPAGYPNALLKNSDGTLTALSMYCTHVCCDMSGYYDTSLKEFYCPCHGSIFDSSGSVVRGPASTSLPTIQLNVDSSGNVFPTGVSTPGPCQV